MSDDCARSDSIPQLSPPEWQELTIRVLKSCGHGRLLFIGLREAMPVCEFLRLGIDVKCLVASHTTATMLDSAAPGRTRVWNSTMVPFPEVDERFDTVVIIVDASTLDAWHDIFGASGRLPWFVSNVVVVLCGRIASADVVASWDARLAAAGARRPMLSGGAVQHAVVDQSASMVVLHYQPSSKIVAEGLPNPSGGRHQVGTGGEPLMREMLYSMAIRLVRPDDRVLGIGVGSEMKEELLANTAAASIICVPPPVAKGSVVPSSPANEDAIPQESTSCTGLQSHDTNAFDFILADSSTGHLPPLWEDAVRVLTPAGRLCILHVAGREDVRKSGVTVGKWLEGCGLLLEDGWVARRAANSEGTLEWVTQRLSCAEGLMEVGDQLVLVLMNPIANYPARAKVGVRDEDSANVLAFVRDYGNPWLVRGLVATGLRATSVGLRVRMADDVLATVNETTADFGAALCVRCYAAMEQGADAPTLEKLLRRAASYADTHSVNPTVLRWQISLLYVAGLIAMQIGDLQGAESLFSRVRKFDALDFSPLLGTKTVGAAYRQGLIAFARGDSNAARAAWTYAVEEAKRLLQQGDWREVIVDVNCPVTFGLPELAAVALEAARAAGGLHALSRFFDRPALVWQFLHCTVADTAQAQGLELRTQRSWIAGLEQAKAWLEKYAAAWEMQVAHRDEQIASLQKAYDELHESTKWLEQQRAAWEVRATSRDKEALALSRDYTLLTEGKEWLERQRLVWEAEAKSKNEQVVLLQKAYDELHESTKWLEQQRAAWEARAISKDKEVLSLSRDYTQLAEGKEWLERQRSAWEAEAKSKDAKMTSLWEENRRLQHAEVQAGELQNALTDRVHCMDRELRSMERRYQNLADRYAQMEKVTAARRLELEEQNRKLQGSVLQQAQRISAMLAEIRAVAATSIVEGRRLRSIESTRWYKLGRWLGLIG